jgi:hypothetical protein
MGWCCTHFMGHFERRYDRGLFVFAEPPDPAGRFSASFWLAMRCVQMADMSRLPQLHGPSDLPLTIQTWFPMWFCPWCGVQLAEYYGHQLDQLLDPVIAAERK